MSAWRLSRLTLLLPLALSVCGCAQRMTIRLAAPLMDQALESLSEESDLEIARQAAAANLKLLEAALKSDPTNQRLLLLACRGFAGYALAFVPEDEPERARDLYERGKDYGLRAMDCERRLRGMADLTLEQVGPALRRTRKRDVPKLFWPAFAWGYWINLSRDKPAALAELPKVEAIMNRVLELDERTFYGGPHLFFASLYAGRTKMLGGDPERGKKHFERNLEINGGRFLLSYYLYARYYAIQTQNKALCEELLNKVLDAPSNLLPDQRLINGVARQRADILLMDIDDYF